MEIKNMIVGTVFELIFVFFLIMLVANVTENNGRIEMCKELNMVYTADKECLTCEDTGRVWNDGECKKPNLRNAYAEYIQLNGFD